MSLPEKLDVMARVWASLRDEEQNLAAPAWHEEMLAGRKGLHAAGKAKFAPWSEAKARTLRNTRAS